MDGILLGAFVALVLITVVLKRISRPTVDRLDGEPAILRNVEALNDAAKTSSLTNLEKRVMNYEANRERLARVRARNDWHNEPRTDYDRLHMSLHTSHTDNLQAMAKATQTQSQLIRELADRVRYLESLLPPDLSPDA